MLRHSFYTTNEARKHDNAITPLHFDVLLALARGFSVGHVLTSFLGSAL